MVHSTAVASHGRELLQVKGSTDLFGLNESAMSFHSIRFDQIVERWKSPPSTVSHSMHSNDMVVHDYHYAVMLSLLFNVLLVLCTIMSCYYHDGKNQQISKLLDENYILTERVNKFEQEFSRPTKSGNDTVDSRHKLKTSVELPNTPTRKASFSRVTPSAIRKSFSTVDTDFVPQNTSSPERHISGDSFITPLEDSPDESRQAGNIILDPVFEAFTTVGTALNVLNYMTPSKSIKPQENSVD